MRNAFATGAHVRLVAAHTVRCDDEHFQPLFEQHRGNAAAHLKPPDASTALQPRTGGRMGNSNEPELVMESVYPLASQWCQEMAEVQGIPFQVQRPSSAASLDARIGAFTDASFKVIRAPDGTALEALQIDQINNNTLSKALEAGGYA
eukprot:5864843-Pyramimonas_sp.AAC.1